MHIQFKPNVFIAGGIGITPFRSIIKYMTDKHIAGEDTLFYIADKEEDFLFRDIFDNAASVTGLKTIYVLSQATPEWKGERGPINEAMLNKHITDVSTPNFYISGPQHMVFAYQELLQRMGVDTAQIKTDFFAGYEERFA